MTVVPLKEILDSAVTGRYGVPAINVVNDLTLESVLAGAVEARSPVIVQASVTTVRSIGSRVFFAMWEAMTANIEVPVALMINGLGGTLISELYLLYGIVHEALSQRGITVGRDYVGEYCTSLDMAGASLTLVRLTTRSSSCSRPRPRSRSACFEPVCPSAVLLAGWRGRSGWAWTRTRIRLARN